MKNSRYVRHGDAVLAALLVGLLGLGGCVGAMRQEPQTLEAYCADPANTAAAACVLLRGY